MLNRSIAIVTTIRHVSSRLFFSAVGKPAKLAPQLRLPASFSDTLQPFYPRHFQSLAKPKLMHFPPRPKKNAHLYAGLFQFQQATPQLEAELQKLHLAHSGVQALMKAIAAGDSQAAIFSDEYCDRYLLYLMKENHLAFWEGMTIYHYLMILMQFTSQQPLHEQDEDVYLAQPVVVEHLVKEGKLTEAGRTYLFAICSRFKDVHAFNLNMSTLAKYVLSLSPSEQWLIKLSFNTSKSYQNDYHTRTEMLIENLPFSSKFVENDVTYFSLPSFSLMQFILDTAGLHPFHMQPIFGKAIEDEVKEMHLNNTHPIQLYSPHLPNPEAYHQVRGGPVLMLWHDLVHIMGGSMLTPEEKTFLFTYYISWLHQFFLQASTSHPALREKILKIVTQTYDLNLTNLSEYAEPKTRLAKYIANTIESNDKTTNFGDTVEEHLFFLLNKLYYQELLPEPQQQFLQSVLQQLNMRKSKEKFYETLILLAQRAAGKKVVYLTEKNPVDWRFWFTLFKQTHNSETLWEEASKNQAQLLLLLNQYDISFFHPDEPMTKEKHAACLKLFSEKLSVNHSASQGFFKPANTATVLTVEASLALGVSLANR